MFQKIYRRLLACSACYPAEYSGEIHCGRVCLRRDRLKPCVKIGFLLGNILHLLQRLFIFLNQGLQPIDLVDGTLLLALQGTDLVGAIIDRIAGVVVSSLCIEI